MFSFCIGKSTNNSLEYEDHHGYGWYSSAKAVDTIHDPADLGQNQYFTMVYLIQPDPWMIIDLQANYCVEGVKIWTFQLRGKLIFTMLYTMLCTLLVIYAH